MTLRSIRRLARCLLDELVDAGSRSSSSVACAGAQLFSSLSSRTYMGSSPTVPFVLSMHLGR